ncbi:MAG: gliding motility-associated C-terminal domain-containing protein [Chitinophagaceae bacterium]|nr:gliding motility-associated C-terminal domain-containing protein [Chitinophagaceae bacterium]
MKYLCGNAQAFYRYFFHFLFVSSFTLSFFISNAQHASKATLDLPGPGDVSDGLVLWLDASDVNADGTAPEDNAGVSTWKDKSSKGNNATVPFGQNPALFVSNQINGKPVLRFTRLADALGSVYITNVDIRPISMFDVTIFTVYKQGTLSPGGHQAPWGADNLDWDRFYISSLNGTTNGVAPFGPFPPYNTPVVGGAVVGKTRLLTAVYDGEMSGEDNVGPENGSAIYFNGKLITTFTDKTHINDEKPNFYVGWDGDNSAYNGDIAEVIVFDRKLSECEILQINKYLADKYGEDFASAKVTASAGNNIICPNSSVTLTASAGQSYKWLKDGVEIADATTITYAATEAGSYQAVVTNESGCSETSAPIVLTKSTLSADISAGGPLEFCSGPSLELSAPAGYEYEWFADGKPYYEYSQKINVYGSGDYTVKVTDPVSGCSVTTPVENAKHVVVHETPSTYIDKDGPTTFCAGDSVVLKATPGLTEYKWYYNDELIPGITGDTYTAKKDGTYALEVKSDKGCVNTGVGNSEFSRRVTVRPLPEAKIGVEGTTAICQEGQVTLYAPADMSAYKWFKNNVSLEQHDQQLTTNAAGSYTLEVTDGYGCSNSTSAGDAVNVSIKPNIQVSVSIGNDQVSCAGQLTTLKATAVNGGTAPTFEWFINEVPVPGNSTPTLSVNTLKPGDVVKVKVISNIEGCVVNYEAVSSSITLKLKSNEDCDNDGVANGIECPAGVNCGDKDQDGKPDYLDTDSDNDGRLDAEEGTGDCNNNGIPDYLDAESCNTAIIMPTLFSPNGDGKNDVIRPIIPGIKTFQYLKIFNRWGNLVFESKDANKGWDGTIGGRPQPQDTYIWISSGIDKDGKQVTVKGLFTLIR